MIHHIGISNIRSNIVNILHTPMRLRTNSFFFTLFHLSQQKFTHNSHSHKKGKNGCACPYLPHTCFRLSPYPLLATYTPAKMSAQPA